MSIRRRLYRMVHALACIALTLAMPQRGSSEDFLVGNKPWANFERLLKEKGVPPDTASLVKAVSRHEDPAVRSWAAIVLGMRGEKEALDVLRKVAQTDTESLVREEAWMAAGKLGDMNALGPLEEILKRTAELDRQITLAARLAELEDPAGYPYVEQAATSTQTQVRSLSAMAFASFVPLYEKGRISKDPLSYLALLVKDQDAQVRSNALIYLQVAVAKGSNAGRVAELLRNVAEEDPDPAIRQQAQRQRVALEALVNRSHDKKNNGQ